MDPSNWRAALYKYMSANPTKEKIPAMASIQIQSTQLVRVPSFYLYPDLDLGDGLTSPAAARDHHRQTPKKKATDKSSEVWEHGIP